MLVSELVSQVSSSRREFPRFEAAPFNLLSDFERHAKAKPHATALVHEGQTLTYGELNYFANRLALQLRRAGVDADDLVGICAENSLERFIGLYGIIKAGAAYLPFEVELPTDRLKLIVNEAKPKVILGHPNQIELIEGLGVPVFTISSEPSSVIEPDFPLMTRAANLAYVLFTSGSTGKPKGVSFTLDGCLNRILWLQATYRLSEGDKLLHKTPYGFDVSFWELFWPLSIGSQVVICGHGLHTDPNYIQNLIQKHEITIVHFVPSLLSLFLVEADRVKCKSLRWIIASGEALTPKLEQICKNKLPGILHNQYGPTESGECSYWESTVDEHHKSTPIGIAIPGFEMAVLDQNLGRLPLGEVGELYIAGTRNLARGYLDQPKLTADCFLPDVISGESGGRMYKTGDLCREIAPGVFSYLGRIDSQVKVRGNRVELLEIEEHLDNHVDVEKSRIIFHAVTEDDKRLFAYVIPKRRSPGLEMELRTWIHKRLPKYMEPSQFWFLDSFPTTTNGKLDVKALPIEIASLKSEQPMFETELQEILGELWLKVLKANPSSIDQDFFIAGGDSLNAIRFVQEIKEIFSVEFPIVEFHESRTIRTLEIVLESKLEG